MLPKQIDGFDFSRVSLRDDDRGHTGDRRVKYEAVEAFRSIMNYACNNLTDPPHQSRPIV